MLYLQKTMFVFSDVRKTIDDFKKVLKNFESRVEFTEDLQKMSDVGICFSSLAFSNVVSEQVTCVSLLSDTMLRLSDCFDGNMLEVSIINMLIFLV